MISLVVPLSPLLSNAVVRFWPIFAAKEVLNVVKSNFTFASESGRSECTSWDRALRLLMAESRRLLTVNMIFRAPNSLEITLLLKPNCREGV